MQKVINIVVAMVVCFLVIKTCSRQIEVSSWEKSKATITSFAIDDYRRTKSYKTSNGKTQKKRKNAYKITFRYIFQVEGVEYSGSFVEDKIDRESQVEQTLKRFENGKEINVIYDPNNPYDSVKRS